MTLAECLERWFKATGIQKQAVAKKAAMHPSKISAILSGENTDPRWSTVEKLAKGFGLPVSKFIVGPRPEKESGRAEKNLDAVGGGARLANLLPEYVANLDKEFPAEDTWQGDVHKAIAALNRALRRSGTAAETARSAKKVGR